MLNGKAVMFFCFLFFLIVGFIKKILSHKMSYFPEPHTRIKNNVKVKLDLSNYATKFELESVTGFDTPNSAKNSDSVSFKTSVNKLRKLDVDKFKPVSAHLKNQPIKSHDQLKTPYISHPKLLYYFQF